MSISAAFASIHPSTSFPKIGDQKVWQRNWFEITILRNVSFKFVNSSFHLSSWNTFIIHASIWYGSVAILRMNMEKANRE